MDLGFGIGAVLLLLGGVLMAPRLLPWDSTPDKPYRREVVWLAGLVLLIAGMSVLTVVTR